MCVIAAVGDAPCQCFSPGGNQTTSPGRISSIGPSQRCAHPQPEVTINVWPNGCACQAVRAPGSNVTLALATRAGSGAWNRGSIRTAPVNQSAGPFVEFCEPDLFISIFRTSLFRACSQLSTNRSQLLLTVTRHVSLFLSIFTIFALRPSSSLIQSPMSAASTALPREEI